VSNVHSNFESAFELFQSSSPTQTLYLLTTRIIAALLSLSSSSSSLPVVRYKWLLTTDNMDCLFPNDKQL